MVSLLSVALLAALTVVRGVSAFPANRDGNGIDHYERDLENRHWKYENDEGTHFNASDNCEAAGRVWTVADCNYEFVDNGGNGKDDLYYKIHVDANGQPLRHWMDLIHDNIIRLCSVNMSIFVRDTTAWFADAPTYSFQDPMMKLPDWTGQPLDFRFRIYWKWPPRSKDDNGNYDGGDFTNCIAEAIAASTCGVGSGGNQTMINGRCYRTN